MYHTQTASRSRDTNSSPSERASAYRVVPSPPRQRPTIPLTPTVVGEQRSNHTSSNPNAPVGPIKPRNNIASTSQQVSVGTDKPKLTSTSGNQFGNSAGATTSYPTTNFLRRQPEDSTDNRPTDHPDRQGRTRDTDPHRTTTSDNPPDPNSLNVGALTSLANPNERVGIIEHTKFITRSGPVYESVYPWPSSYRAAYATLTSDVERGGRTAENALEVSFGQFLLTLFYFLICNLYLTFLFGLPSLYFSRVDQVLKDADLSVEEMTFFADHSSPRDESTELAAHPIGTYRNTSGGQAQVPSPPGTVAHRKLKNEWKNLVDDFIGEWKTMNILSAVLVPGIIALFQIDSAAHDPTTRSLTFWSLLLALSSLVHGSLYIIQFSRMRNAHTIAEWAKEAQKNDIPFWNMWIMLALPAIWLAWSILVFIVCVIWFMWNSRANLPPDSTFAAAPSTEEGFHIFTCVVFGMVVVYFLLALNRFNQYSVKMTKRWTRRASLKEATGMKPNTT